MTLTTSFVQPRRLLPIIWPTNAYEADDDDEDTPITYAVEGADKDSFSISPSGVLTVRHWS